MHVNEEYDCKVNMGKNWSQVAELQITQMYKHTMGCPHETGGGYYETRGGVL